MAVLRRIQPQEQTYFARAIIRATIDLDEMAAAAGGDGAKRPRRAAPVFPLPLDETQFLVALQSWLSFVDLPVTTCRAFAKYSPLLLPERGSTPGGELKVGCNTVLVLDRAAMRRMHREHQGLFLAALLDSLRRGKQFTVVRMDGIAAWNPSPRTGIFALALQKLSRQRKLTLELPQMPADPFFGARMVALLDGQVLKAANLLRCKFSRVTVRNIVRAAEQHGTIHTLCGIKPDQKKADFTGVSLDAADAVLLAYDIKVNAPLKSLKLRNTAIGVEGAKAIAAALPR